MESKENESHTSDDEENGGEKRLKRNGDSIQSSGNFIGSENVQAVVEIQDEKLVSVAKTGDVGNDWNTIKILIGIKINQILDDRKLAIGFKGNIIQTFESRKEIILELLSRHNLGPPFTIQRLAEVLLNPTQFSETHKLMNSLEKLLSVTPLE